MATDNELTREDASDNLPPSKRPRVLAKACESCKMKKSRCDSARPQCDPCRRKGITCVYREKGQPGLRPGYKKDVEQRLTVLEDSLERMNQSLEEVLAHLKTAGFGSNVSLGSAESTINAKDFTSQIIDDPPLWQDSRPPAELEDLTPSPTMDERLEPAAFASQALNTALDNTLPSEDVLRELVELFFEFVYPWAPLFHRTSFIANMLLPDRQIILHGIVVVSFRFWKKPAPTSEIREMHIKSSRDQILLRTFDVCSLPAAQALALLAIDAIGQGTGPRTWNVMSMLVAASRHLVLAKGHARPNGETSTPLVRNEDLDADDDFDLSNIEAEEKRRVFWVIYNLDRFSSCSHGQPGGIDSKNVNLPYPSNDADWGQEGISEWFQMNTSVKPSHVRCRGNTWHYYLDLLALMDRSHQFLIQSVNLSLPTYCQEWQSNFRRLNITLSTWFDSLPRDIKERKTSPRNNTSNFDPIQTMIHATYHLIEIRMYTVAAFPGTNSPYLKPSASSRGRCRRAIEDVTCLTASLQPHELVQLGPMFAFVVWVAARSLIILWTTGFEATYNANIPPGLEDLIEGLREISFRWPCAQRYIDLINLILDARNSPGAPLALDIFNDTRRTAHGLHHRLKNFLTNQATEINANLPFDFLDVPGLEMGDLTAPWMGSFGSEIDGEWL